MTETEYDILERVINEREELRDKLLFSETAELRLLRGNITRDIKEYYFLFDYLSKKSLEYIRIEDLLAIKHPHVNYNALLKYYTEVQKIYHPVLQNEFENIKRYLPELEKYATKYELF